MKVSKKEQYKLEDKYKPRGKAAGMKIFASYLKPYAMLSLGIVGLLLLSSITSIAIPYLIKYGFDEYIAKNDISGLGGVSVILFITIIINSIINWQQIKITGTLGQNILFKLRREIFEKLQELPVEFFSVNKSGNIIQRITNDVDIVSGFLSEGIVRLIGFVFNTGAIGIVIYFLNPTVALISYAFFILCLIYLYFQGDILKKVNRKALDSESSLNAFLVDNLNGFKIIKSYGQETYFENDFEKTNSKTRKLSLISNFIGRIPQSVTDFLTRIGAISILVYSLYLLQQSVISVGTLLSLSIYLLQFFRPINGIASLWTIIQRGFAAIDRLNEILKLQTNIKEIAKPYSPKKQVKGLVEFKNVNFKYEGDKEWVLKDIDLQIQPGEKVAIVGPTGAGKTTFVNLIARLYDPQVGTLLIDGIDVKKWDLGVLRKNVGYMLQDTIFFSDTLYNNLIYPGKKLSKESIIKLINSFGVKTVFKALPNGLSTKIERVGENLSSGQKQVIAIIRLLIKDPKILILDEATSSVDSRFERLIQKSIDKVAKNRTTFIIAHRLSTIENVDRIILISKNKILENGSKQELLKKKGYFYKLYKSFKGKRIAIRAKKA